MYLVPAFVFLSRSWEAGRSVAARSTGFVLSSLVWTSFLGQKRTSFYTLPPKFCAEETLNQFAQKPGSLSELNFMTGLRRGSNTSRKTGCLFTGEVVRGGYTMAPPAAEAHGV